MTTREILVDDLQDIEDVLLALDNVSNRRNLTDLGVFKILARTCYHILVHCIHLIERSEKK